MDHEMLNLLNSFSHGYFAVSPPSSMVVVSPAPKAPRMAKLMVTVCGVTLLLAMVVIISWLAGLSFGLSEEENGYGYLLF